MSPHRDICITVISLYKGRAMDGLDLIFSNVCNATFCESIDDNPLHDVKRATKHIVNFVNGKHLRIGTYTNYPVSWTERTENGTYIGRGVAFELVEILRRKFNFTYEVVVPVKNLLYSKTEPDQSLIGLLKSNSIDFVGTFVPILKNTDKVVKYSTVIDEGQWTMMMKRPKESAAGSGLLAPFDEQVWYLILIAVIVYGPCVTLLTWIRNKLMPDEERYISLAPSVWFVYGAFIKQGTTLSPSANTPRVLFATWWLFIILLSAFYTANLTAFLTLSKFTLDVETVQDLYKKNYRWIAPEGSAVEYAVTSPDENLYFLHKTVKNGRAKFPLVSKVEDYLSYIDDGAIFVHRGVGQEYMMYYDYQKKTRQDVPEAERCTYVVAPGPFMKMRLAFAYQLNSKLKKLFNSVIKQVVRSGILTYLGRRSLPDTKICPLDLQSKDRQLRNADLLMTYYIMAVGLAAAIAVFVVEIFISRYISNKGEKEFKLRPKTRKIEPVMFDDNLPPPYDSLFGKTKKGSIKKIINGREYWVINKDNGETRLIPVRTPSALLYR